jgi:hypothetical protein
MEAQKPTVGKFAMNYGVILGVIMIIIAVIMYVTGMSMEGKQWPQYLYYIIFPIVIFYAISQFKKQNANVLSLGQAIKLGLVIAAISAIVYAIYILIFSYIIDPEFMGQMKEVVRDKMLEAPNATQEMVDQQMKVAEMFMSPLVGSALWIGLSMFFGLIWSLIGGLVMKKE